MKILNKGGRGSPPNTRFYSTESTAIYTIHQYMGVGGIPNKIISKDIKQKPSELHGEMSKSTILVEILALITLITKRGKSQKFVKI